MNKEDRRLAPCQRCSKHIGVEMLCTVLDMQVCAICGQKEIEKYREILKEAELELRRQIDPDATVRR